MRVKGANAPHLPPQSLNLMTLTVEQVLTQAI